MNTPPSGETGRGNGRYFLDWVYCLVNINVCWYLFHQPWNSILDSCQPFMYSKKRQTTCFKYWVATKPLYAKVVGNATLITFYQSIERIYFEGLKLSIAVILFPTESFTSKICLSVLTFPWQPANFMPVWPKVNYFKIILYFRLASSNCRKSLICTFRMDCGFILCWFPLFLDFWRK